MFADQSAVRPTPEWAGPAVTRSQAHVLSGWDGRLADVEVIVAWLPAEDAEIPVDHVHCCAGCGGRAGAVACSGWAGAESRPAGRGDSACRVVRVAAALPVVGSAALDRAERAGVYRAGRCRERGAASGPPAASGGAAPGAPGGRAGRPAHRERPGLSAVGWPSAGGDLVGSGELPRSERPLAADQHGGAAGRAARLCLREHHEHLP